MIKAKYVVRADGELVQVAELLLNDSYPFACSVYSPTGSSLSCVEWHTKVYYVFLDNEEEFGGDWRCPDGLVWDFLYRVYGAPDLVRLIGGHSAPTAEKLTAPIRLDDIGPELRDDHIEQILGVLKGEG